MFENMIQFAKFGLTHHFSVTHQMLNVRYICSPCLAMERKSSLRIRRSEGGKKAGDEVYALLDLNAGLLLLVSAALFFS